MRSPLRLLILMFVIAGCAMSTPLPPDAAVQPPPSAVPRELAAFSGKWVGQWDGVLDAALVVEEIRQREAVAIYSWGAAPQWRVEPGFQRVRSQFDPQNTLRGTLANGAVVSYTMTPAGTLNGLYERGSVVAKGVFKRAEK
jgi:hypothetical protein